jgi:alcohol dehydrogenase (cytochrome c)
MPTFDPEYRPGDNLYTSSTIALDVDTGGLTWFFQEVPNEQWDFDTPNPRMLFEVNGQQIVGNFARNGFFYTHDRANGAFQRADQWAVEVNWTAGIDPKTGKPVDYVEGAGVQDYAGVGPRRGQTSGDACPTFAAAPAGLQPPAYDPTRMVTYVQTAEGCMGPVTGLPADQEVVVEIGKPPAFPDLAAAFASPVKNSILSLNVATGEVAARVRRDEPAGETGTLATAGNLVFAGHPRGDFVAYDSDTLEELWSFNVGTAMTAPATTYSVGGRQYVAVVTGGSGSGLWQPAANIVVFALPN